MATLPAPPATGRGAAPAAGPPGPARSRNGRDRLGGGPPGTLAAGDPRGVLNLAAGRRHNQRTRDWRIGHLITVLADKAEAAGISLTLVDERGTSSTCPACQSRVPKPAGRVLACPACQFTGHRDSPRRPSRRRGRGSTPAWPASRRATAAPGHRPGRPARRAWPAAGRCPRWRAHHQAQRRPAVPGDTAEARRARPQPGLADLPRLVEESRDAGARVQLDDRVPRPGGACRARPGAPRTGSSRKG